MSKPSTKPVKLDGSKRRPGPGAKKIGPVDPADPCEITLKLRRQKEIPEPIGGALAVGADDVAGYGASDADVETVKTTLATAGLTIISWHAGACTIKAAGTAREMEELFNVRLARSRTGRGEYRSRVGHICLPRALHGIVTGVFGLDTRLMARGRAVISSDPLGEERPPAPQDRPWFLPQELAAIYDFPDNDGSGQTVRIIALGGGISSEDIQRFCDLVGVAGTPTVVRKAVETLSPELAAQDKAIAEAMLDVEVVAAICPGARIVVYFSNFTEKGWIDALDAALADSYHGDVISISYGLAEGTGFWTQQAMDHVNDKLKEAAARGIPVCVASGDDGSADQVLDGQAHADFPATSPYVLAVGGTLVEKTDDGHTEKIWFEGTGLRADQGGSSGGGVSEVYGRPDWQNKIDIPSVNPPGFRGRCVPDVSANAAIKSYFMVANGAQTLGGGTSAAAPLWAALLARLACAGTKLSFVTPLFYQPTEGTGARTVGEAGCNDIKRGDNDTVPGRGYQAVPGYDAATGWGSPIGSKLVQLLRTVAPAEMSTV